MPPMHTTLTPNEQNASAPFETSTTATTDGAAETTATSAAPNSEFETKPSGHWIDHTPAILAGDRLVLTVTEAGTLLGLSRAFTYELVARGEIPVIRLGRRIVVPKAALLEMVGVRPPGNSPNQS
jgi:excisionase family DNA binding protein